MSVFWCPDHPADIYHGNAVPLGCPRCGKVIVDTETGRPKGIIIPCNTHDGSKLLIGQCMGEEPCEFAQFRNPEGKIMGEVHFAPGTIQWGLAENDAEEEE